MNILTLLSPIYINLYISQYLVRETELLYVLWMLDVLGEVKSRSGTWEVREWSPVSSPAALAEVHESDLQGSWAIQAAREGS